MEVLNQGSLQGLLGCNLLGLRWELDAMWRVAVRLLVSCSSFFVCLCSRASPRIVSWIRLEILAWKSPSSSSWARGSVLFTYASLFIRGISTTMVVIVSSHDRIEQCLVSPPLLLAPIALLVRSSVPRTSVLACGTTWPSLYAAAQKDGLCGGV